MAEFRMPSLGADMDEGTVVEWLVKPGDEVRKGDVIAVIDTAKAAIDAESFCDGTVGRLVVDVGQTVPVGTVLATIAEPSARPAAPPKRKPAGTGRPAQGRPEQGRREQGRPEQGRPAAPVSPLIRKLAHELKVDAASLHGTGRGGAVTRADVERAAAGQQKKAAPSQPAAERPAVREAAVREAAVREAAVREAARARPRVHATPRARQIAADLGIDLAGITGTGPGGSVREADVRAAAPAPGLTAAREAAPGKAPAREAAAPAAAGRSGADRARSMRQAIGRLMARSKREIPHYYVSNTVDMTRALDWLHERNRELAVNERLVPAAMLLKAAAMAAREVPGVNGYWADDQFSPADAVHLGVVISLRGGGLLTPAIHDAADLPLAGMMSQMRDLVIRARAGRLRSAELADATITVTNLGDQGVESVFGVIYPPQVALVGIGKITERPFAAGGLIGARPVVVTTLAADHRASDGYTGARYLAVLSDLLQRPEEL